MTISSISTINPLQKQLETKGLTSAKANLVASDVSASIPQGSGATPASITAPVRAAIDAKISADVSSGKLSEKDAAAVRKTLDDATAAPSGTTGAPSGVAATGATAGKGSGGGAHGGGGGGGSDSAKTILSEAVTVTGSTETTVITYTDGTTSTETGTAAVGEEDQQAMPPEAPVASAAADNYGAKLDQGLLINKSA